jgi:hypothetical protein
MTRSKNKRARLGGLLALALGAFALLAMPGVAAAKDHNHDRIPDRWEKRHHLSLNVNQAGRDQDGDHLRNTGEFKAGDNPRDDDSDNDGVMDGEENAGTIASFDAATGKLTINLFGGETASGTVTEQTRIECGGDEQHGEHHGEGSDDNSGAGTSSHDGSGPPGQGDDENDDPPGHDGTPPGASEGPGHGADNSAQCATADLVAGAVVQEAELELEHGVGTFSKVELGG